MKFDRAAALERYESWLGENDYTMRSHRASAVEALEALVDQPTFNFKAFRENWITSHKSTPTTYRILGELIRSDVIEALAEGSALSQVQSYRIAPDLCSDDE